MPNDERIDDLVLEIQDSGLAPEDVCRECPELLPAVRESLRKIRAMEAQVDSLFPLTATPATIPRESAPNMPLIDGYEMQKVLGRGGMGIVYLARHLKLNRVVALKMVLTGSYASRQEQSRFVREAESVAALKHNNVVQLYDIGEVQGNPYYTMEYVGGGNLAQKLQTAPLSARDSAKLLAVLAKAIHSAHQAGILHRDLKPANILLTEDETPKVTDFGLARRLDSDEGLTRTGARLGTPGYMAPEQALGNTNNLGPAVDVFSLGAMLYEMLVGHPPFQGKNWSDIERRMLREEPTRPRTLNSKVPHDLETICLKCLEKSPRDRYASASDLAEDLERFLRHEPIRARPVAPAERLVRWVRRNPLLAALAITSVVLVGLIIGEAIQESLLASGRRAEKTRLTARFESGVQLIESGRHAEARAILGKLGDGGNEDLRTQIDGALRSLDLVERLEAIGVKRALALNADDSAWQPNAIAAGEYEAIFAAEKIGRLKDDPADLAQRIAQSVIRDPWLAALDDWAVCESDEKRRQRICEVAGLVEPVSSTWSNQFRDHQHWNDAPLLANLAENIPAETSVSQLRTLGDRLSSAGVDAKLFRQRVQREHLDSFLANLALADDLRQNDPVESIRYYQAALAIHPTAAPAHNNLGVALSALGRPDEAIEQYLRAARLEPSSAVIAFNLGSEYLKNGLIEEAMASLKHSIELDPQLSVTHQALAEAHRRAAAKPIDSATVP